MGPAFDFARAILIRRAQSRHHGLAMESQHTGLLCNWLDRQSSQALGHQVKPDDNCFVFRSLIARVIKKPSSVFALNSVHISLAVSRIEWNRVDQFILASAQEGLQPD
jgi:hypothetical protein